MTTVYSLTWPGLGGTLHKDLFRAFRNREGDRNRLSFFHHAGRCITPVKFKFTRFSADRAPHAVQVGPSGNPNLELQFLFHVDIDSALVGDMAVDVCPLRGAVEQQVDTQPPLLMGQHLAPYIIKPAQPAAVAAVCQGDNKLGMSDQVM